MVRKKKTYSRTSKGRETKSTTESKTVHKTPTRTPIKIKQLKNCHPELSLELQKA